MFCIFFYLLGLKTVFLFVLLHAKPTESSGNYIEKSIVDHIFLRNTCLSKIIGFDLHIAVFDSFKVFFRFLAETPFRTIAKLLQKASSRIKTCSFGTFVILPEVTDCNTC